MKLAEHALTAPCYLLHVDRQNSALWTWSWRRPGCPAALASLAVCKHSERCWRGVLLSMSFSC